MLITNLFFSRQLSHSSPLPKLAWLYPGLSALQLDLLPHAPLHWGVSSLDLLLGMWECILCPGKENSFPWTVYLSKYRDSDQQPRYIHRWLSCLWLYFPPDQVHRSTLYKWHEMHKKKNHYLSSPNQVLPVSFYSAILAELKVVETLDSHHFLSRLKCILLALVQDTNSDNCSTHSYIYIVSIIAENSYTNTDLHYGWEPSSSHFHSWHSCMSSCTQQFVIAEQQSSGHNNPWYFND